MENTKNLEYVEMKDYDRCCGLNGVTKLREYGVVSELFKEKHKSIVESNVKIVLTSCLGCEVALRLFSFGKYKVMDLAEFLSQQCR